MGKPVVDNANRFGRGAWLALGFTLFILAISAAQVVYRYFLPTDGWEVTENTISSPELIYLANLVGAPSGLQPFDLVTGLEGQALADYPDGQRPAFWQVGNTVRYEVLRAEEPVAVDVPIVRWTAAAILRTQIVDLAQPFFTGGVLLVLAISLLAFYRRPDEPATRALLVFAAVLGATTISGLVPDGLSTTFDPIAFVTTTFFSYIIFVSLLAPALLAFTLVFPRPKPVVARRPWLAYAPFLLGGLFTAIGLITNWWTIGWLGTLLMMALSIVSLIHSARTMRDAVSRAQLLWAFGGLGLGIGLFLFNFPSAFGWVDAYAYEFTVVASLATPVMALGLAMAVLRYRLFDIDVIIRRTTSYAILTGLLLLVYFGSVIIFQRLFSSVTGQTSTVAVVLSTLLIAALFLPLRRRVQDWIDRRFFRRKYDAEKVLNAFAATVRDETDLDELTTELERVIQETMQPEFVSVWLKPTERIANAIKESPFDEVYR